MNSMDSGIKTSIVAQTDNFIAWKAEEPDEEATFHIEINNLTIHFFNEEWEEFKEFKKGFVNIPKRTTGTLADSDTYFVSCEKIDSGDYLYTMEIPGATLFLFEEDWIEFCELIRDL